MHTGKKEGKKELAADHKKHLIWAAVAAGVLLLLVVGFAIKNKMAGAPGASAASGTTVGAPVSGFVPGGNGINPGQTYAAGYADPNSPTGYSDANGNPVNQDGSPYVDSGIYADPNSPTGYSDGNGNPVNQDGSPYNGIDTGAGAGSGADTSGGGGGSPGGGGGSGCQAGYVYDQYGNCIPASTGCQAGYVTDQYGNCVPGSGGYVRGVCSPPYVWNPNTGNCDYRGLNPNTQVYDPNNGQTYNPYAIAPGSGRGVAAVNVNGINTTVGGGLNQLRGPNMAQNTFPTMKSLPTTGGGTGSSSNIIVAPRKINAPLGASFGTHAASTAGQFHDSGKRFVRVDKNIGL